MKLNSKIQNLTSWIIKIIGSKLFTGFNLVLFISQSLWLAFSFRYPLCYDEIFHFPVIKIYSNQLSPFIFSQPTQYDRYQDLSNGSVTIFHYLMSFPLRLIEGITNSQTIQILALRVICIAMVAAGLYLFYRLFTKIGVSRAVINIGLLLTISLPIFILTSATINYDNLLFLLTAWYLLLCVRIIIDKKANWLNFAGIICVGLFASLTKNTFMPIFAASVLYIAYISYRRFGLGIFKKLWKSFISSKLKIIIPVITISLVLIGFFSFKYIRNIVMYRSISPSCAQTLGVERCMANGVFSRNYNAKETIDTRVAVPIYDYTAMWYRAMSVQTVSTAGVPADGILRGAQPLSVMAIIVFFGIPLSFFAIALSYIRLFRKPEWRFLLFITGVLILSIYIVNVGTYYNYHSAFAMQPRYMLSIVPIVMVATVMSFCYILKQNRALKLVVLTCGILLLTQGGGIITHIVRSEEGWYWDNNITQQANGIAKNILKPFIIENIP